MTPPREVRPTVGLMATTPVAIPGLITLQSVSVPNAIGTMFAETDAALPELLPSGRFGISEDYFAKQGDLLAERSREYGFRHCPPLAE